MTKRIYVRDMENIRWSMDGDSLSDIQVKLTAWIIAYGEDARIDINGDDAEVVITKRIEESDEVYQARLTAEEEDFKAVLNLREKVEYERLKVKFGDA